jgi:hypothetical protein
MCYNKSIDLKLNKFWYEMCGTYLMYSKKIIYFILIFIKGDVDAGTSLDVMNHAQKG